MTWNALLLSTLRALLASCACEDDASDTLTIRSQGNALEQLGALLTLLAASNVHPHIAVHGMTVAPEELAAGDAWVLTVGKRSLISALGFAPAQNETAVLFLSIVAFDRWATRQTSLNEGFRWTDRLTILVDGLSGAVAGPQLRCSSLGESVPAFDPQPQALSQNRVKTLVQVAPEALSRQIGQTLLTQGDLASPQFACLRRWAERDASQLLCDEVTYRGGYYHVVLRGGRRVTMTLDDPSEPPDLAALEFVQTAVAWCFAEHRDARHALLIDRLSLDAGEGGSFIVFLRAHLQSALQDARDRYRLVVLEKKDAAAKETRDILKEVRAQADIYASKVRDLTSTFLRDLLAALLLIGLGLLGRMNSNALAELLDAGPVDAFFRILASYFVLSATLQIATHWRDLHLTTEELRKWWGLARTSLPGDEVSRLINHVITPRRLTFFIAVILIGACNLGIATALWNWKLLLTSVLYGT